MISVIVPVYNAEKTIDKCVVSLLNQTIRDIEIILIDDGSKDKSGAICDRFAQQYSNIKVFHKPNGGLVSAWKAGVKLATAEFVGFVDADDYCDAEYFQNMYQNLLTDPSIDMIAAGYKEVNANNVKYRKGSCRLNQGTYEGEELEYLKNTFFRDSYVIVPARITKLIKKEILLKNMELVPDAITLAEDLCITYGCFLDSQKICVTEQYGYNYIIYSQSMSHKFKPQLINNYLVFCEAISQISKEKSYYNDYIEFEKYRQLRILIGLIIFDNSKLKTKKIYLRQLTEISNRSLLIMHGPSESKSQRLMMKLFQQKHFTILCLLGVVKKAFNRILKKL